MPACRSRAAWDIGHRAEVQGQLLPIAEYLPSVQAR